MRVLVCGAGAGTEKIGYLMIISKEVSKNAGVTSKLVVYNNTKRELQNHKPTQF